MNFGEKFPYALLTFSQSLSKLVIGYTFSQKFVEADYWGVHLLPKTCQVDCSHTPLQKNTSITPHLQTHQYPHPTPTHPAPTHYPTTQPIPLLLRVDSDEMWQKPVGFWLMRCWTARKGPRMGPKVHEVDSARRTNKA